MQRLTARLQLDILVKNGRLIVTGRIPEVGLARPCPHNEYLRTLQVHRAHITCVVLAIQGTRST